MALWLKGLIHGCLTGFLCFARVFQWQSSCFAPLLSFQLADWLTGELNGWRGIWIADWLEGRMKEWLSERNSESVNETKKYIKRHEGWRSDCLKGVIRPVLSANVSFLYPKYSPSATLWNLPLGKSQRQRGFINRIFIPFFLINTHRKQIYAN